MTMENEHSPGMGGNELPNELLNTGESTMPETICIDRLRLLQQFYTAMVSVFPRIASDPRISPKAAEAFRLMYIALAGFEQERRDLITDYFRFMPTPSNTASSSMLESVQASEVTPFTQMDQDRLTSLLADLSQQALRTDNEAARDAIGDEAPLL